MFVDFDKTLLVWSSCLGASCACFFCFRIWASFRNFNESKLALCSKQIRFSVLGFKKFWDLGWTTLLLFYYFYSFKLTGEAIRFYKLPLVARMFCALESVSEYSGGQNFGWRWVLGTSGDEIALFCEKYASRCNSFGRLATPSKLFQLRTFPLLTHSYLPRKLPSKKRNQLEVFLQNSSRTCSRTIYN